MKLVYTVVALLQCIYAAAVVAREDNAGKPLDRPIAVITPMSASSSSPRLGTDSELASYFTIEDPDVILADPIDDVTTNDEMKRAMGMLRMGRSMYDQLEEEKRTMGMLRMGKRAMGMLRMGRSELYSGAEEPAKRSMGMLRMGRSSTEQDDSHDNLKRAMGMLRMGRGFDEEEKRAMGMLRMGRSQLTAEKDKKSMSMLRMGKRNAE